MEENINIDWIDSYLDGELNGEELERFQEQLAKDLTFRIEVNAQKMVRDSIKRAEVKSFLAEINEEYEAENSGADNLKSKSIFSSLAFKMTIAASIILLVGVGLFVINHRTVVNQPQMFIAQSFTLEVIAEDGLRAVAEEILVQVIKNSPHKFHFSFTDGVLKLYLNDADLSADDINIFYDTFSAQPYEIEISGVRYVMVETEDDTPLPLIERQG